MVQMNDAWQEVPQAAQAADTKWKFYGVEKREADPPR